MVYFNGFILYKPINKSRNIIPYLITLFCVVFCVYEIINKRFLLKRKVLKGLQIFLFIIKYLQSGSTMNVISII